MLELMKSSTGPINEVDLTEHLFRPRHTAPLSLSTCCTEKYERLPRAILGPKHKPTVHKGTGVAIKRTTFILSFA